MDGGGRSVLGCDSMVSGCSARIGLLLRGVQTPKRAQYLPGEQSTDDLEVLHAAAPDRAHDQRMQSAEHFHGFWRERERVFARARVHGEQVLCEQRMFAANRVQADASKRRLTQRGRLCAAFARCGVAAVRRLFSHGIHR